MYLIISKYFKIQCTRTAFEIEVISYVFLLKLGFFNNFYLLKVQMLWSYIFFAIAVNMANDGKNFIFQINKLVQVTKITDQHTMGN